MRRARPAAIIVAGLALCACGQHPQGAQNAAFAADQADSRPLASAVTAAPSPITPAADFVAKAAASDAFELQAAQIAAERASDPRVKDFAAMMLRDHGKSSADLKQAVAESGQSLAAAGGASAAQQQGLADLAKLTGRDFDKAYMAGQVSAHQQALAVLQDYAQNGDSPALKAFASENVGVVQQHLQLAKTLRDQLQ